MFVRAVALLLALQQAPVLHERPAPGAADAKPQAAATRLPVPKRSELPPNADGEYQFGETGEVIELYVEDHILRGYIVKRSERWHAGSTPLTYDFSSGSAVNNAVSFTTRTLHGEFYSFSGSVVRGPAADPSSLGYYLLRGQLTLHADAAADTHSVVLERLGQH